MRRLILLLGAVMVLAACQPSPPATTTAFATSAPPTISPTTPASTEAVLTESPTPTIPPTSTTQPTGSATPDVPLSEQGPWLLFAAREGCGGLACPKYLWAMNADGTGLRHLIEEPIRSFAVRPGASTRYAEIAFVTGDPHIAGTPYVLKIAQLPEGSVQTIATLTSPDIYIAGPDTPTPVVGANNALAAINAVGGLAWSPGGSLLAFVGAMWEPTADVYTYNPATGEITQISSGPLHAGWLSWSPNGRWLLHQAADAEPEAGGWFANGIWATSADGSIITPLFDPATEGESWGEEYQIFGWANATTVLVGRTRYSENDGEIRAINVETGEFSIIRSGAELAGAAYDPGRNQWLFWYHSNTNEHPDRLLFASNHEEREISLPADTLYDVSWSEGLDMFVVAVSHEQSLGWTEADGFIDLHAPAVKATSPTVSPDGQWWAWCYGWGQNEWEGVWVGRAFEPPRQISDRLITDLAWSPDSSHIFLVWQHGVIWVAAAPDFEPRLVVKGLHSFYGETWLP